MESLFKRQKKGQLGTLSANAIAFGVLVIVVAVMALVTSNIRDTQAGAGCNSTTSANCSAGYNASSDGVSGFNNISGQMGLLGTIIIFSVVIGLVIAGFVVFAQR